MEPKDLIRVSELAPMLGVTSGRVYQLIGEGEVPATRVGRALRIPRPALEAWLQRCTADANRSARQAAAKKANSRPEPGSDGDRTIADAVRELAEDRPFGWRGSATELLEQLQAYRVDGAGDLTLWPMDGRSLSVALRRLVVYLARNGVEVSIGHRGYRGKRLVSIRAAGTASVAGAPASTSRRDHEKAAPSKGSGSARSRTDARVGGYTGTLAIDPEMLVLLTLQRESDASPVSDSQVHPGRDAKEEA